jgi:hypothetical protein
MLITTNYQEWLAANTPTNSTDIAALKAIADASPLSYPSGGGWHSEVVGTIRVGNTDTNTGGTSDNASKTSQQVQYNIGSYGYQDVGDSRFVIGKNGVLFLQDIGLTAQSTGSQTGSQTGARTGTQASSGRTAGTQQQAGNVQDENNESSLKGFQLFVNDPANLLTGSTQTGQQQQSARSGQHSA